MNDLPHEAYLAAIAGIDGVGPVRMRWLLSHGSPIEVWDRLVAGTIRPGSLRPGSLESDRPKSDSSGPDSSGSDSFGSDSFGSDSFGSVGNFGRVDAAQLAKWKVAASRIEPEEIWRRCVKLGVGVVSLGSAGFPKALADDPEPPIVLFQKGEPDSIHGPCVAIVGTRRATGYGIRVAEMLGAQLVEQGVVVVSGLALGIDAAAHRGALSIESGPGVRAGSVIAVVANGLDAPCPSRNRQLATKVAEQGVIYSEVPPGMPSAPWRFPVRNRVIAGLADAVVVVESAGAGGSMHTVREALARDRPVLAVPGPIDSRASEGVNQLIRDGAAPCLGVDDVMMALGLDPKPTAGRDGAPEADRIRTSHETRPEPTENAALVLESLDWRPVSLDGLAVRTGLSLRDLASALSELETARWIARSGGWVERRGR